MSQDTLLVFQTIRCNCTYQRGTRPSEIGTVYNFDLCHVLLFLCLAANTDASITTIRPSPKGVSCHISSCNGTHKPAITIYVRWNPLLYYFTRFQNVERTLDAADSSAFGPPDGLFSFLGSAQLTLGTFPMIFKSDLERDWHSPTPPQNTYTQKKCHSQRYLRTNLQLR